MLRTDQISSTPSTEYCPEVATYALKLLTPGVTIRIPAYAIPAYARLTTAESSYRAPILT